MVYGISFITIIIMIGLSEWAESANKKRSMTNDLVVTYNRAGTNIHFLMIISFIFAFFILWMIGALRKDVGIDYSQYSILQIPRVLSGELDAVEPLSSAIFLIGAKFGSYQYIFALIQLLIVFFVCKGIYLNSVNYTFSFFLFFFTGFFNSSLNLMRQSITIAIFIYAIRYIFERKKWNYFFLIIVATLVHKVAIIYLPIYFLYGFKFSKRRLLLVSLISVAISLSAERILFLVTTYFNVYRNYWGFNEMSQRTENFSGTYWILNLSVLFAMVILRISSKYTENLELIKKIDFFIYMQIIPIVIMIVALLTYLPNFDRILTMFSYAQIISIPYFFILKNNRMLKICLLFLLIAIFLISFFNLIVFKNIGGTFPYKTIGFY